MQIKIDLNLVISILLLTVVGCQNGKNPTIKEENVSIKTKDTDSLSPILNWSGSYFSVLPCASCPGINTLITLNSDGSYEKTTEYLGVDSNPITTRGMMNWVRRGQTISIGKSTYMLRENQLIQLDKDNKRIEGELADNYVFTKTELQPPPLDSNEGYFLQRFVGSDKKVYSLVFNTNPKVPTVLVETKGFKKIFSQTHAWAKGAIYSGNNTQLTVKGNFGTLEIRGKKIDLRQQD